MRRTASVLALLCLLSCKRSEEDEAARQRIFSQQHESAAAPAQGRDALDATALASQPQLAERVLQMPQAEIAQRLGPHKAQQRVQFAWFRGPGLPDGGSEVSLSEETTLLDGPEDEFSVRLANDHNQGLELVWVKGEVFVKSLYGPFHKRRTDRTDPPRVREQAMSGLATFDRLARGLQLKNAGETTFEGRRAVRYQVTGFGARPSQQERSDLPPVQYPEDKVDPDTARRLELWEKEQPSKVSGTLMVDAATAAPLACDLQGHFKVPGNSNGPAAELDLHTVLVTTAVGRNPGIKAPPFEPETTVPHAVKDPLRFLGKGATPPPAAEEPDEPDEEEPAPPK
ncbi:MAG TPA: hypothetical protein VIR81_10410 [Myxococcales bacterium]|nr:hypothetical protein [Myxococcales bacterium]